MRRSGRRTALIAVLSLGLALFGIFQVAAAVAQPDTTTSPRLQLLEQTAWVTPDGDFVARLAIDQPAPGAELEVELHGALADRDAFGDSLDGSAGRLFNQGPVVELGGPQPQPDDSPGWAVSVNPDATIDISLAVRDGSPVEADRVLLPDPGVYPIVVSLDSADGEPLDELVLHLIRVPSPDPSVQPLGVAVVAPIHAPVALGADGTTVLSDDDLALLDEAIAPLAEHPGPALSVTPIAETIDALSRVDDPRAVALLDRLRSALAARQIVAQPYIDLDLSSWVARDLDGELSSQFIRGAERLATDLNAQPDNHTWIAEPTITAETLTKLRELGVDQVVMPEAILGPLEPDVFTSSLAQTFDVINSNGNRQRAIMADRGLAARIGATGDPVLDANRLLADLSVLYFADPDLDQGAVVVLPDASSAQPIPIDDTTPERAPADPLFVDTLLDALGSATIVAPETLDDLFARTSDATVDGPVSDGSAVLVRGFAPQPTPSLDNYPDALRETQRQLAGYRSLLGVDQPLPYPLEELELASGAAGFDETERQAYLDSVAARIDRSVGAIHVDQPAVTLTGRQGVLPISVRNDLSGPVTVRVEVESEKLDFPDGSELVEEVPPGISTLEIGIEARASGAFPVDVRVGSTDGILTLSDARVTVRSSAVSGLGIVLSVLAALFLLIWWARHFRKVRRANRLVSTRHPAAQRQAKEAQEQFIDGI